MTVIIRYYNVCVRVLRKKYILPQNETGDLRPSSMDGSNIGCHLLAIHRSLYKYSIFEKKKKVKTTKNESHNDNGAKIMNNQKQDH